MSQKAWPALYIPHGGGPCFFMEWDPPGMWKAMESWLRALGGTLPEKPAAIVVVSAHWEEDVFTVMTNPNPPLIYDYYGFPAHTYAIDYPASGSPELAEKIVGALEQAGIPVKRDAQRGFDHGVFIPLKLIYPAADVPIVQLSLNVNFDPAAHAAVGRALAPLRKEKILIVGSGMSYHNLRKLFQGGDDVALASAAFDGWLDEALASTGTKRSEALKGWLNAPYARQAHPREEHLLPLMVVAGAAEDETAAKIFSDSVMGATVSAWQFG